MAQPFNRQCDVPQTTLRPLRGRPTPHFHNAYAPRQPAGATEWWGALSNGQILQLHELQRFRLRGQHAAAENPPKSRGPVAQLLPGLQSRLEHGPYAIPRL